MTHRIAAAILVVAVTAARANAQTATSSQPPSARAAADFPEEPPADARGPISGYVSGNIGRSSTSEATAATGSVEAGIRLSKHLSVFGAYGLVRNLQPSTLQPYVDIAVAQIAKRNIYVSGEARDPAEYAWGGLRLDVPTSFHVAPYVIAGAGWARSTPSAQFTYAAGSPTVNGSTATAGQDATADVLSTGAFVGDGWNAVIVRWAAGLSIPIRGAWSVEGRYSWSRWSAPDAVTTQELTAGLRLRF